MTTANYSCERISTPDGFVRGIGLLAAQLRAEALQSVHDNSEITPTHTQGKYSDGFDMTAPVGYVEIVGQQAAELRALALQSAIDNSEIIDLKTRIRKHLKSKSYK